MLYAVATSLPRVLVAVWLVLLAMVLAMVLAAQFAAFSMDDREILGVRGFGGMGGARHGEEGDESLVGPREGRGGGDERADARGRLKGRGGTTTAAGNKLLAGDKMVAISCPCCMCYPLHLVNTVFLYFCWCCLAVVGRSVKEREYEIAREKGTFRLGLRFRLRLRQRQKE